MDKAAPEARTKTMPNGHTIRRWFLAWIGLLILWLLFVFQFSGKEILVGAAASAFTAVLLALTLHAIPLRFAPASRWLLQARHLPAMIAKDLCILAKDLMRRVIGKRSRSGYELVEFVAPGKGARASAQRALVLLFLSMSPNSIVLDIDAKGATMLLHHLAPEAIPDIVRNLQA